MGGSLERLAISVEKRMQILLFQLGERGGLIDRLVECKECLLAGHEGFKFSGDPDFDGGERGLQFRVGFPG